MKKINKFTGIVLSLTLIANSFSVVQPLIANAVIGSEALKYGDYLYYEKIDEDDDGTDDYVEISDCDESVVSVEIPSEIEGMTVTNIGWNAFYGCTSLSNITIPDSITSIEAGAFMDCTSLSDMTISDSVIYLGKAAFGRCISLENISIPDGVKRIEEGAFSECSNLKSIKLPEKLEYIGYKAFSDCASLESVTIPEGVISLDYKAFSNCINLKSVILPESLTCIYDCAFLDCISLKNISIFDNVDSIGYNAFGNCISLESITIENPECEIYYSEGTISNRFDENGNSYFNGTIYGYENSTAQAYSEKYDCNFALISEKPIESPQGDISGNGEIDLYDAIEIAKSLIGARTFTDEEKAIADFNGDGIVDLYDAIGIAKKMLEK